MQKSATANALPSSSNPYPIFTLFSQFPFELRLKIWNLTIEPRIIICRKGARAGIPSLLHTCESREEGLRHYQLLKCSPADGFPVYFNTEIDTLFSASVSLHDSDWDLDILNDSLAVEQVQHLAFSRSFWERMFAYPVYDCLYERIRRSKVLKTITIIRHQKALPGANIVFVKNNETERTDGEFFTAEDWRYEMQGSQVEHPEWNEPELKFARLQEF